MNVNVFNTCHGSQISHKPFVYAQFFFSLCCYSDFFSKIKCFMIVLLGRISNLNFQMISISMREKVVEINTVGELQFKAVQRSEGTCCGQKHDLVQPKKRPGRERFWLHAEMDFSSSNNEWETELFIEFLPVNNGVFPKERSAFIRALFRKKKSLKPTVFLSIFFKVKFFVAF